MLGSWTDRIPDLAKEFQDAEPFPLVVIDGFLEDSAAEGLLAEFPSIDAMRKSNDYIFADKRQSAQFAQAGSTCKAYHDLLLSEEFAELLGDLTGRSLFVDASFHGGGFHQGGHDSFLDTHVDFNIHPGHSDWLRVLNVLLYLNKGWQDGYGGDLLVRTDPRDAPRAVAPLFNRGVIMLTSDNTYHGYRRMSLPADVTRKSVAAYAYELVPVGSLRVRTTQWAPEEAGTVKTFLGKHWSNLAAAKNKALRRPLGPGAAGSGPVRYRACRYRGPATRFRPAARRPGVRSPGRAAARPQARGRARSRPPGR
jgi:2OG-Fe(II) oxygenase superfamily